MTIYLFNKDPGLCGFRITLRNWNGSRGGSMHHPVIVHHLFQFFRSL